MEHFNKIKGALKYIDEHLNEPLSYERLAGIFHFSPYYFHRMFSVIVGKTITAYVRARRLENACKQLAETDKTILSICMDCGFDSSPAFSRTFKNAYGVSPSEYRKQGYIPSMVTVDEMIIKFTNRLKGGILLNPRIIKRDRLIIAGVIGDGTKTGDVWQEFEELSKEIDLSNKVSENGYEIRLCSDTEYKVHVGFAVTDENVNPAYTVFSLPASQYASFDVYVERGYDSENNAMAEWLSTNSEGYSERHLDDSHYVVEYYDERFNGEEADSIVEIWVPIEKSPEK